MALSQIRKQTFILYLKQALKNQKINIVLLFFIVLFNLSPNQTSAIIVIVNHAIFKNDQKNGFIELYLKIPVNSICLKNSEGKGYNASLNYHLKFSKGDSVVFLKSYNLISPEIVDTTKLNYALTDLKRIELPYGIYTLEVSISDNNKNDNNTTFKTIIDSRLLLNTLTFSAIELLDTFYQTKVQNKFSRNNYDLIPNVFNSFTNNQKRLYFYTELYNINRFVNQESFFIKYYIKKDSIAMDGIEKLARQSPSETNYIFGSLDISQLLEGNYELIIEVYSNDNKLLKSKSAYFTKNRTHDFFMAISPVSNKIEFAKTVKEYSTEQLHTFFEYLEIIAEANELGKVQLMAKENNLDELQINFYNYWINRDSINPGESWMRFLLSIEECNRQFSTPLRKGYLTDRGRVFLNYGPPNTISESNGQSLTYPYQIWHYYILDESQRNKRFVFFNRTGALNEFELIHSDARGEPYNDKWKDIISKFNNLNTNDERFFGDFIDNDFME